MFVFCVYTPRRISVFKQIFSFGLMAKFENKKKILYNAGVNRGMCYGISQNIELGEILHQVLSG